MIAQIVVHTNAHPYHVQLLTFWFALGPIALIFALIIWTGITQMRRRHKKSRRSVR